jgi:hypothetical protein
MSLLASTFNEIINPSINIEDIDIIELSIESLDVALNAGELYQELCTLELKSLTYEYMNITMEEKDGLNIFQRIIEWIKKALAAIGNFFLLLGRSIRDFVTRKKRATDSAYKDVDESAILPGIHYVPISKNISNSMETIFSAVYRLRDTELKDLITDIDIFESMIQYPEDADSKYKAQERKSDVFKLTSEQIFDNYFTKEDADVTMNMVGLNDASKVMQVHEKYVKKERISVTILEIAQELKKCNNRFTSTSNNYIKKMNKIGPEIIKTIQKQSSNINRTIFEIQRVASIYSKVYHIGFTIIDKALDIILDDKK